VTKSFIRDILMTNYISKALMTNVFLLASAKN